MRARQIHIKDTNGRRRTLYFDRQYNDTLGLMSESAHANSIPVEVPGVDARRLQVRLLSPLDLAVSKLARFGESDQADIKELARAGLINAKDLRELAESALVGYVGRVSDVQISIDLACRMVDETTKAARKR